ncbi:hypothetical protein Bbelb_008040 [Branchiostoma belcheri]|nr:hypothetical protein Bbelb_008040 [Branchiostoma belcheri]
MPAPPHRYSHVDRPPRSSYKQKVLRVPTGKLQLTNAGFFCRHIASTCHPHAHHTVRCDTTGLRNILSPVRGPRKGKAGTPQPCPILTIQTRTSGFARVSPREQTLPVGRASGAGRAGTRSGPGGGCLQTGRGRDLG